MKAIDFIRKMHKEGYEGRIMGSYCLDLLHNTGYNDIDYYTPLTNDVLEPSKDKYYSPKVSFKDEITICGKVFKRMSGDYSNALQQMLVPYVCESFSDVPVNIIFFVRHSNKVLNYDYESILESFDMDILRISVSSRHNFERVDFKLDHYYNNVLCTGYCRLKTLNKVYSCSQTSASRLAKYKSRLARLHITLVQEV